MAAPIMIINPPIGSNQCNCSPRTTTPRVSATTGAMRVTVEETAEPATGDIVGAIDSHFGLKAEGEVAEAPDENAI